MKATPFALIPIVVLFCAFHPTTGLAQDPVIQAQVDEFEPGAVIHVCCRLMEPGNPFLAKGEFDCQFEVRAVDAPFPGGGLSGDQLMGVVEKAAGGMEIQEVRVRALEEGLPAGDPGLNMMTVGPGADEFYNSYVGRDDQGRLAIFLDIEPKPE